MKLTIELTKREVELLTAYSNQEGNLMTLSEAVETLVSKGLEEEYSYLNK